MLAILSAALAFSMHADLPAKVDLRKNFDQLGLTVCTQNGPLCWDYTIIGLLEYELATRTKTVTRLSPGFLAWAASATDAEGRGGSNFGRAHRGLEKYGIATLPFGGDPDAAGHGAPPTEKTLADAAQLGRVDINWIRFWNREPLTAEQLQTIKTEIAAGHPVAVGMQWPNRLQFEPNSFVMKVPRRRDIFDGHCVALVGYEDRADLPGGGAFLFRNSWGAQWGDGGYALMPYALLSFCINDALSVRLQPPAKSVATPSVFEAESLPVTEVRGPQPAIEEMQAWGTGWGENRQLAVPAEPIGQGFTLTLAVPKSGRYELQLVVTESQNSGRFRVEIPIKSAKFHPFEVDGVGPGVSHSRPIPCGPCTLKTGANPVRFTCIGQGPASSGTSIGIDQLRLVWLGPR